VRRGCSAEHSQTSPIKGDHTMGWNIYVGNLAFTATEQDLRRLFARFGEVASVTIITEAETGRPRGFGFVAMARAESAQRAIATLNTTAFMGRTIVVSEALPKPQRHQPAARETGRVDRRDANGGTRNSGPRHHTTRDHRTTGATPRKEGDTAIGSKSIRKRR
jgi:RNA recognition motif-containing protein